MPADGKGGGMDPDAKADASNYYDRVTPNNNRQSNQITLTREAMRSANVFRSSVHRVFEQVN